MLALPLALVLAAAAPAASDATSSALQVLVAPEGAAALGEPAGVTTDALGRIWATDAAAHRIVRWDAEGRWLGESGALGSDDNQFRRPTSLARLGSLGVAVLDVDNRRIMAFDQLMRRTDLVVTLDDPALEGVTGHVTPVALAADRGGALYVADSDRDRLLVFDFAGNYRRTVGAYGTAAGSFHGLTGVAVAAHGEIVTLERGLPPPRRRKGTPPDSTGAGVPARVQWLDAGGAPLASWDVPSDGSAVVSIAVDDSGRVAVGSEGGTGDEVRVFSIGGLPVARIGGVSGPHSLAFAPDGSLLVAESGAGRVRRFRPFPAPGE